MNKNLKNKIPEAELKVSCLHAVSGDNEGEIDLIWQPVKNAASYVIQVSQFQNNKISKDKWKHADIVTRSKYTIAGLKSGKQYKFRIAAITSIGQHSWSDPVSQISA